MKVLEYLSALAFIGLVRFLPLAWARALGRGLAGVAYRLLASPRRVGEVNLRKCFPDWGDAQVRTTLRSLYRQLGWALGEICHLPGLDRHWVEKNVAFEGQERVEGPLARGRGVIALVSHFGNWELHGAVFARRGYDVKVIAFPQSNKRVDDLIRRNRESSGMKVVYTGHKGTGEVLEHLRRGGVVGMLADQNAGDSGLRLPFFGRDCSVAKAPAVLARKTGAALVPIFLVRQEKHRFVSKAMPEVPVSRTDDAEKDVLEATKRWLKVQEDFIREHPDHYFWLHRRWKHYS